MITEVVRTRGHKNISGKHKTTFEITKDAHLTPRGDCIIGISADKGISQISEDFKNALKDENATLEILLKIPGTDLMERVTAFGNPKLTFTHPTDIVVRKSSFICSRTLCIHADRAAVDFSREFIEKLKSSDAELLIEMKIINNDSPQNKNSSKSKNKNYY